MSKIKERPHVVLAIIAPIALVGFLFFNNAQKAVPQGNTNPVIEWVVIQLSSKTPGNVGISVTIQGYNFTATNNAVHSRGKILAGGLGAVDRLIVGDSRIPEGSKRAGLDHANAKIITLELPEGIPCSSNEQCPINVVNTNGTSNTVSFRLHLAN